MQDAVLMGQFPDTRFYDLSQFYSDFVPFTVNSVYPIHRWYQFKEGYSKDLVHLTLGSLGISVNSCLDPFAGSGTTPLACQEIGIRCHSIEVNPFLHHMAKTKLNTSYTVKGFDSAVSVLKSYLIQQAGATFATPSMSTITENPRRSKWLFNQPVLQALLTLHHCSKQLASPYADLFSVVISSILTEVGNTVKDGKCVRYKKNWRNNKFLEQDVYDIFFERTHIFREDMYFIEQRDWLVPSNADFCMHGSALEHLNHIPSNTIDAVITSPPYLNSFDYTDVYMPELWVLGFVHNYQDVRRLRKTTIRSHVQVKWKTDESDFDDTIRSLIGDVLNGQPSLWNDTIPHMIGGYFLDLRETLIAIKRVLRPNGRLCIVVGTSSYNKVTIPTDLLIARIASIVGFKFEEMRIVRNLKRSSKQTGNNGKTLPPLRESIIILSC